MVASRDGDAIARLVVARCDHQDVTGTGFWVDARHLVTAFHVIEGETSIALFSNELNTRADIVATDEAHDIAVLLSREEFDGDPLTLSTSFASGAPAAVIGFPLGANTQRISSGILSGVDESSGPGWDGGTRLVFDAAANPGNSGGPLLNVSGDVLGVVSHKQTWTDASHTAAVEGTSYAVPVASFKALMDGLDSVEPQAPTKCAPSAGSSDDSLTVEASDSYTGSLDNDLIDVLKSHGSAVNEGEYALAYSLFSAAEQRSLGSEDSWAAQLSSTYWTKLIVNGVGRASSSGLADVTLTTRQDADDSEYGQSCSVWDLTYHFRRVDGEWLIDKATWTDPNVRKPVACE